MTMTKKTTAATEPITDVDSLRSSGRLTITVEEACALLGCDRKFVYKAMDEGEIPEVRILTRRFIPREPFIARFLEAS